MRTNDKPKMRLIDLAVLPIVGMGLLFAKPVKAEEAPGSSVGGNEKHIAVCREMSKFALTAMSQRQRGIPLADIMERLKGNDPTTDLARIVLEGAYSEPLYSVRENKDEAISEYSSKIMLKCLDMKYDEKK